MHLHLEFHDNVRPDAEFVLAFNLCLEAECPNLPPITAAGVDGNWPDDAHYTRGSRVFIDELSVMLHYYGYPSRGWFTDDTGERVDHVSNGADQDLGDNMWYRFRRNMADLLHGG